MCVDVHACVCVSVTPAARLCFCFVELILYGVFFFFFNKLSRYFHMILQ